MTKTYFITGMTCNNCKASVEKALRSIDHVEDVSVNLEASQAIITSKHNINLDIIKRSLPKKYAVLQTGTLSAVNTEQKSELKQLLPLFLIFGYITIASFLLNFKPWDVSDFMLDFMGLFYIVFSFFKLLDLKGFPKSFRIYDPLAKAIPAYGWIYPFIEIGLGLMFLMRFEIPLALLVTIIVLGITTVGVTKALLDKKSIQCACLGTALKLPMTKSTFIENSIMLIMAVIMLVKIYS